jgi:hypothetical protein
MCNSGVSKLSHLYVGATVLPFGIDVWCPRVVNVVSRVSRGLWVLRRTRHRVDGGGFPQRTGLGHLCVATSVLSPTSPTHSLLHLPFSLYYRFLGIDACRSLLCDLRGDAANRIATCHSPYPSSATRSTPILPPPLSRPALSDPIFRQAARTHDRLHRQACPPRGGPCPARLLRECCVLDYTLHELCACEPEPVPGVRPGLQADEHRQLPRGEEQRRCSPVVGGGCPDCAVCHADVRAVEALQKRGGGEPVCVYICKVLQPPAQISLSN